MLKDIDDKYKIIVLKLVSYLFLNTIESIYNNLDHKNIINILLKKEYPNTNNNINILHIIKYLIKNNIIDINKIKLSDIIILDDPDLIKILIKKNITIESIEDIIIKLINSRSKNKKLKIELVIKAKIFDYYTQYYISNTDPKKKLESLTNFCYILKKINLKNKEHINYLYNTIKEHNDNIIDNRYHILKSINNEKIHKSIFYKRFLHNIHLYNISRIIANNLDNGIIDIQEIEKEDLLILKNVLTTFKVIRINQKIKRFISINDLIKLYDIEYKHIDNIVENSSIIKTLIIEIINNMPYYSYIFILLNSLKYLK
jgi:hypothetical protein